MDVHRIPGNVLAGNWRAAWFISDEASDEQFEAIHDAFAGKLGGPLADLAGLFGEVVAVERAPIVHETRGGQGHAADRRHRVRRDGALPRAGRQTVTTLRDSLFSTVPGSPAYVAKADRNRADLPQHDFVWDFEGRNAIQSDWKLVHAGE